MKQYWKSLEELENNKIDVHPETKNPEDNILLELLKSKSDENKSSRRDFLKVFGFSLTSAALAASCERPVQKAIPFLIQPEEVTPGIAKHYASTFHDGNEYCSIVVKTRDGRPIKIEGNTLSSISRGGTSARVQASLLSLYDDSRYKSPVIDQEPATWDDIDTQIIPQLEQISARNGKIVIMASGIISPSTKSLLNDFTRKYPGTSIVYYDPVSLSAMLTANDECFGISQIPNYHLDKADVIVAFQADFLGNWLSPTEFTKQYSQKRKLDNDEGNMSYHIQVESGLSMTGTNADKRIPIKPSEELGLLAGIYHVIAGNTGISSTFSNLEVSEDAKTIAGHLLQNQGKSLVISSTNEVKIQKLVNAINSLLGNYGSTIDLNRPSYIKQGNDKKVKQLVDDMHQGNVDAIMFYQVNPVYDIPEKENFADGLSKVGLTISFTNAPDETSSLVKYVCPDSHFLESWNDAEPKAGVYSLAQPVIHNIFNTRQFQDTLLKWSGSDLTIYDYLRNHWENQIFIQQNQEGNFENFWTKCLQDGVFEARYSATAPPTFRNTALQDIFSKNGLHSPKTNEIELHFFESVAIGNGMHANNPWLQELPDPVTKACWDNYACVSPKQAAEKGWKTGTVIRIDDKFEIPVLLQPGQAYNVISIALGYGRENTGKVADGVGKNAYALLPFEDGYLKYTKAALSVETTGKTHELALTQTHHSMEGREIIRETTFDKFLVDPASGNEMHAEIEKHHVTLYPEKKYDGYHWGMAVDLSSCIGCGACTIACQSENNVPIVGKKEVQKRRIMHWIRIDRYYSENVENPEVSHQPVMCQHCDHAPCENVCPVSATNHSNEGLNQMAYNRCIGTKYCINNCPYRVRRFNWFNYVDNVKFNFNKNSDLGKLVLNPDVTVRERGVVEKCTFCVQRIQEKKLVAKKENRMLEDGEVKTACVQACPADALVFGDMNDPNSKISKLFKSKRKYHLLEELHTLPSVGYLTKVRNKKA